MPPRHLLMLALSVLLALVAGCGGGGTDRQPGDPVTEAEAEALAGLLYRNYRAGGADFVVTAPYAEGTVLTLTGEVDFARSIGTARAVTRFGDGRPDEARTLFFSTTEIWFGDVPGLPDALAAAGLPDVRYLKRPITTSAGGTASLIDVLVALVPNLSARFADDPRAFTNGGYTWQAQRSINRQLAAVFAFGAGKEVAVSATDQLLVQYATRLSDQDFTVTITLSDHGEREIELPGAGETADAADHPEIAAALGV